MESVIRNLFGTKSPSLEAIDAKVTGPLPSSPHPTTVIQHQEHQLSLRDTPSQELLSNEHEHLSAAESVNNNNFNLIFQKHKKYNCPRFDRL